MLKNGWKLIEETLLTSLEETFAFGRDVLGKRALPNDIFCFFGPLGVGKTALIKGLAAGFIGINPDYVTSPTFSLLNIYQGSAAKNVYHFDLYRLEDPRQFYSLGFEEYLCADGICCIEWSERIVPLMSDWSVKKVILSYRGEKERYCEYSER